MSLPNLQDNHLSAQMKTLILWCDSGYEDKWKEIESVCKGIPVQAMIGDQKLPAQEDLNPCVPFTFST